MAYSMVQTLLHFNYEKLKMGELIQLYEVADKYIEVSLTMAELQLTRDLELGNKAGFNQILNECMNNVKKRLIANDNEKTNKTNERLHVFSCIMGLFILCLITAS